LRDEIAEIRRVKPAPKAAPPTRVSRPNVGHV
jgi:hypothetical protein